MKSITTTYKIQFNTMSLFETELRQESALVWNKMVKLHKHIRKKHYKWPNKNQFQKHLKKKSFKLHSQTIQALTDKFFSNIDTTRTNRKVNKKARYPYKLKYFQNVIWKGQSIKVNGNTIRLPNGRHQKDSKYKLNNNLLKIIEQGGKIVQAELGNHFLTLTITQEVVSYPKPSTDKVAAIDLGLIHTGVITDGEESLAFVGRGLRSINQNYHKSLSKIVSKQSTCKKRSRKWKKLQKRKKLIAKYRDNYTHDFYHKVSRKIVDFALKKNITKVVYGDITNISHKKKKKMSKRLNQELAIQSLGRLMALVRYKLEIHNIELEKINEADTTRTCPACGHKHKPRGRIYQCTNKECRFRAYRDEVGAYNILNKYMNGGIIKPNEYIPTGVIKYLRIIKHKFKQS